MVPANSYITRKDLASEHLWKKGGPTLARLDIELTERCNNNCIHCLENLPKSILPQGSPAVSP